jgi:hypothetical protein
MEDEALFHHIETKCLARPQGTMGVAPDLAASCFSFDSGQIDPQLRLVKPYFCALPALAADRAIS